MGSNMENDPRVVVVRRMKLPQVILRAMDKKVIRPQIAEIEVLSDRRMRRLSLRWETYGRDGRPERRRRAPGR
ncbi:MAG: hypothetical protein ACLGQU_00165 [Acidobacteriota bacterium]